jgi:iron complex transport system permease protein
MSFLLITLASLLAAVATATAGPIAFVALVSPHLTRLAFRRSFAPLFAMGLVGAVLVLAADLIGERALWTELPVGVVTPMVGAPYLLWLLQRSGRVTR